MKERRPSGEPVLAEVGPPVILSLGVAGYLSVIRSCRRPMLGSNAWTSVARWSPAWLAPGVVGQGSRRGYIPGYSHSPGPSRPLHVSSSCTGLRGPGLRSGSGVRSSWALGGSCSTTSLSLVSGWRIHVSESSGAMARRASLAGSPL
jgi:hypothetical protein